jgi:hypothetical protein
MGYSCVDLSPKMWVGMVTLLDESGHQFYVALKLELKDRKLEQRGCDIPAAVCALPTSSPLPQCRSANRLASFQLRPLLSAMYFRCEFHAPNGNWHAPIAHTPQPARPTSCLRPSAASPQSLCSRQSHAKAPQHLLSQLDFVCAANQGLLELAAGLKCFARGLWRPSRRSTPRSASPSSRRGRSTAVGRNRGAGLLVDGGRGPACEPCACWCSGSSWTAAGTAR